MRAVSPPKSVSARRSFTRPNSLAFCSTRLSERGSNCRCLSARISDCAAASCASCGGAMLTLNTRPSRLRIRARRLVKMKLSYCSRNGFMAYVGSGNRPVLGVFHEIRCHQTNIRTFIRKDSDHAGTSADFTIQSLNHVGR